MSTLESAKAVTRMQTYIEQHITRQITLKELAGAAGYSPWHAARLFSALTGVSPFEYIRARRLTQAALRLRDGDDKVLDVALDFVFDSHEGFTRAFSKQFGIAPKQYRIDAPPIRLFLPGNALDTYLYQHREEKQVSDKQTKAIFVQVIERPARKLMLKRGVKAEDYYAYCEEVGCDVWEVLTSVKQALYEPVGLWLPDQLIAPGTSKYVQGVELPLDYDGVVPDGYELIELPPCTMMVFQGEPYDDADFEEAIGEIWEHVKTFDPTLYGYDWDAQAAPRFQLAPMGYRGYIEAYPVKKNK